MTTTTNRKGITMQPYYPNLTGRSAALAALNAGSAHYGIITKDCEPICRRCIVDEWELISNADPECPDDVCWYAEGAYYVDADLDPEDVDTLCAHCGKPIIPRAPIRYRILDTRPLVILDPCSRTTRELAEDWCDEAWNVIATSGNAELKPYAERLQSLAEDLSYLDSSADDITEAIDDILRETSDILTDAGYHVMESPDSWIISKYPIDPVDDDIIINERGGRAYQHTRAITPQRTDLDAIVSDVRARMDRERWWPNVWIERERGDYDLIAIDPAE